MPITQTIESVQLLGKSDAMQQVYKMIGRLCNLDCAVLLIGEKGSGKKVVARALHFFSQRSASTFQFISSETVNYCSDEELLGIDETHQAEATCYVTDLGSIPLFSQHQLSKIHKQRQYRCFHTKKMREHNYRFVVGCSQNLKDEIDSGRIALDVFYDWNFCPVYIPPLRDRKEDIPLHAEHFLELCSAEMRVTKKALSPEAIEALQAYDWPGNLDELKLAIRNALAKCNGNYIWADHLPSFKKPMQIETAAFFRLQGFLGSKLSSYVQNSPSSVSGNLYRLLLPQMERALLEYAMKKAKGNKNRAAALLGLHRNTLNKKLQKIS
jgi:two-component system, NtrC family, nitrogen regulation response regulator GlnG